MKKHEQQQLLFESRDSVLEAADKLVRAAEELMRTAKTEEDLRVGFEKALEFLCRSIKIKLEPRYEKYAKFTRVFSDVMHARSLVTGLINRDESIYYNKCVDLTSNCGFVDLNAGNHNLVSSKIIITTQVW